MERDQPLFCAEIIGDFLGCAGQGAGLAGDSFAGLPDRLAAEVPEMLEGSGCAFFACARVRRTRILGVISRPGCGLGCPRAASCGLFFAR